MSREVCDYVVSKVRDLRVGDHVVISDKDPRDPTWSRRVEGRVASVDRDIFTVHNESFLLELVDTSMLTRTVRLYSREPVDNYLNGTVIQLHGPNIGTTGWSVPWYKNQTGKWEASGHANHGQDLKMVLHRYAVGPEAIVVLKPEE